MKRRCRYYRLRNDRILALLRSQELKRWWVAEFAGIHRTTLRRWLSGRIDRVRQENVDRLATLLSTHRSEIAIPFRPKSR